MAEAAALAKPAQEEELTDGFNLIIDAMKLNGIETIYGVPGIPITDFGRMAQAAGMRVLSFRHEQNAGYAAGIAGFLTRKPGICLTVSAPGFLNGLTALAHATPTCFSTALPQRPDRARYRHHQLLLDDPDLGLVGARDRRPAAGRLRGDGPARDRQALVQGGLSRAPRRRYRHRSRARDPRRRLGPPRRRLSRPAGQAVRPGDARRGQAQRGGAGDRI